MPACESTAAFRQDMLSKGEDQARLLGKFDEMIRTDQIVCSTLPAHQHLSAYKAPSSIELRLAE